MIPDRPIRYAKLDSLPDYLALGWHFVGIADPRWSAYVVWLCECRQVVPVDERGAA